MTSPYDSILSTSGTSAAVQQPIASDKLNGYDEFMSWRKSWNINSFAEEVFIEFFREAAETLAPESLPTLFSTLQKRMRSMHNVNIMKFASLIAFLTQKGFMGTKNILYHKQKSVVAEIYFSNDEISKFLTKAPDSDYLAIKAATVIGMHTSDGTFTDIRPIRHIRVNMVNNFGTGISVQIPRRERMSKVYSIFGEYAAIVRKYLKLRLRTPSEIKTVKFFTQYRQGKCVRGTMGRGTIGKMAQQIAKFLKLENPENYTTNSFRMISPKLVDKGFHIDVTESSRSTIPTCNVTGSVAISSNVGTKKAPNSIDYMRLSPPDADDSDTYDAIDVETDDESIRAHIVASSSEADEDVNQSVRDIIANNCSSTKQQRQSQLHTHMELVDASSKPNEKVSEAEIVNTSPTVTHRMVQSKINEQAKEIVRLKQLVENQSLAIEILADLLAKSMKRSIGDEMK